MLFPFMPNIGWIFCRYKIVLVSFFGGLPNFLNFARGNCLLQPIAPPPTVQVQTRSSADCLRVQITITVSYHSQVDNGYWNLEGPEIPETRTIYHAQSKDWNDLAEYNSCTWLLTSLSATFGREFSSQPWHCPVISKIRYRNSRTNYLGI